MKGSMKKMSGKKAGPKLGSTASGSLGSIKPALFTGRVVAGKGR